METTALQPSTRAIDASAKPRGGLLAALRKPTTASSDSSAESADEASDSERYASSQPTRRASPQTKPDHANGTSLPHPEEDDALAAYEQMKERLAASKATTEAEFKAPVAATTISSEDEDDVPVMKKTRRPMVRPAQSNRPSQSPVATPRSRRSSPGLFVTPNASPEKSRAKSTAGSDSDEASRTSQSADLQARVRRIRAERLARKKQEEEQAQQDGSKSSRPRAQQESGSESDGENGRRLTQQAKPTRKAGKKAMELMARDQQRISRNMQLTHQAKTKKKYGLDQLFSKFAYNAPDSVKPANVGLLIPDASSNLASSDAEADQAEDTPPTSPPMQEEPSVTEVKESSLIENAASTPLKALDKGKGRAPEFQHLPPRAWEKQIDPITVQNAQLSAQKHDEKAMVELSDSEDDIDAAKPKSRFPVFDQLPLKKQQETTAALRLRSLAQLNAAPEPRKNAKSMTKAQLDQLLARNSREQGRKERAEKLADLRKRGIYIETEEEREKNQMEIEDMVAQFEKQRQEDLKLAKTERDEAKKNGETIDELPSSDESDGDYVGSGEEDTNEVEGEEEADTELSGSDDEEMEEDDDTNDLIATEADETSNSPGQLEDEYADMEDEVSGVPARKRTTARPRNIVMDDEDESDNEAAMPASATQQASQNEEMAAFGFGNANVGLGLTQMFAGTMANLESGSQSQSAVAEAEQDSLDFLRNLPDTQPGANFSQVSDLMVPNSQSLMSPQKDSQAGSDNHFSLGISQLIETSPAFSRTQLEDLPEPTQDAGFSFSRSPARFMPPPSTMDTVMMSIAESPIRQRKGKLHRRQRDAPVELSDDEAQPEAETILSEEDDIQRPPKPRDAFTKLQIGAKKQKAVNDFNKKTSLAKDAFMEQAEESEDEYAGLGGASDDDSGDEDEETKNMIEHGEVDVDERQIAAFYA